MAEKKSTGSSGKSSAKANANRVKKAAAKYDVSKSVVENTDAIVGVVAATATSAKRSSNKKQKNLYIALLVILIVAIVGVLIFGYYQGWFDSLLGKVKLNYISATYNGDDIVVGGTINKSDVTVTAYYTDKTEKVVTDFTVSDLDSSTMGNKIITISYTEDGVTETYLLAVKVVAVNPIRLVATYSGGSIEIGTQPDKSKLTVTVHYNNGESKAVTNYASGTVDSSSTGQKNWEISYTEDGVTVSTTVKITVVDGSGSGGNGGDGGTVADMSIHFMELGNNSNGDCIYIKAGDTDILIDAGSTTGSAKTITSYVDKYCTDGKLEYVIATHGDTDHIAAFTTDKTGIFDYYECETIIQFARTGKSTDTLTKYYAKVKAEQDAGANVYTALDCVNNANGAQKVYQLAEGITMEVLYQKYYETYTSNENDYSVCLLFTQGKNHYLFLGDLEEDGEKSLVANNDLPEVELYKAGHHGSPTSANEVLLSVIKPKVVCVSCVAGHTQYTQNLANTFPSQAFINRIAPYTDKVYVTTEGKIKYNESTGRWASDGYMSMNGNIVFSCINGVIEVHGSNNDTVLKDTEWFKNNRDCPAAWL